MLTINGICAAVGLSERMVRRYLVALDIRPTGIHGRLSVYDEGTPDAIRAAVVAARAARADAVRESIAKRGKATPIITVDQAKRKGGSR